MNVSSQSLDNELLHISPKLVQAGLVVAGFLCWLLSDFFPNNSKLLGITLIFDVLVVSAWMIGSWRIWAARWFIITAAAVVIAVASVWLDLPQLLFLYAILPALAATMISVSASVITAAGSSVLLVLLSKLGLINAEPAIIAETLAGICIMLVIMAAAYQRVYQAVDWYWTQYLRAQEVKEEALDHQLEISQSLDDLAHSNRQMEILQDKLVAMRTIAEEAERTKADFVAKVSHEFRTPLNMIIGLTDLLIETPDVYGERLPPNLLEDLHIVHRNCAHLSAMINDVLDLSGVEAGYLRLYRERVNLSELITEAQSVVSPLMRKKHLDFKVSIPADLPKVYCDRTRIRQVILNLMSNAVRFTQEGGVTVLVTYDPQYVRISIRDTGLGIAPEDAKRVFEPFNQSSSRLAREQGGSGLGLAISKQFLEMHGGHIWLESEPGVGSAFSFNLPVSPPLELTHVPMRWMVKDWDWFERTTKAKEPATPQKTRFIICDEAGELYDQYARYFEDVEVISVSDLPQAIQELQQCPAHAVVLNADEIREVVPLLVAAKHAIPDTPIIGCSVPSWRKHVRDSGVVDHLVKPVTRAALESAIKAIGEPVKRILVVDDDPDVLQLLTRILQAIDASVEVVTASSGELALEQLYIFSPDLMLLDLVMAGMDGWQVVAFKNRDDAIRHIPVVLVSGQDLAPKFPTSDVLCITMDKGISLSKLIRSSRWLASTFLEPD